MDTESPSILLSKLPGWSSLIEDLQEKLGTRKISSDEDPLIFYHMVKTAGSSFFHAFRLSYAEEAYYDSFNAPTPEGIYIHHHRFATLSEEERTGKKFIHLHVPAPLHQYIPGPSSYATMLRDPTKLVISLYFWQKKLRYGGLADWAALYTRCPLRGSAAGGLSARTRTHLGEHVLQADLQHRQDQ